MKELLKKIDRVKGCLLGGALGDALGYPIEFLSLEEIKRKYGPYGLEDFDLSHYDKALVSDDTQMTLFTVNGILVGETKNAYNNSNDKLVTGVYYSYLDWLTTQGERKVCHNPSRKDSWLLDVPELHHRRAPGNTCLSSLRRGGEASYYSLNEPFNNSKGCGAVMRIAPIGLIENRFGDPFINAAEVGELTHCHPLSTLSCQLMAMIIASIMKNDGRTLWRIAKDSLRDLKYRYDAPAPKGLEPFYKRMKEYLPSFIEYMKKPLILAKYELVKGSKGVLKDNTPEIIKSLGEGWVAEEALAIALYCALRYQSDPMVAMRAAVNHDGDSDSTGSLTGQLLGAYHGEKVTPLYVANKVELLDVILELGEDLAQGCIYNMSSPNSKEKTSWENKYLNHHRDY